MAKDNPLLKSLDNKALFPSTKLAQWVPLPEVSQSWNLPGKPPQLKPHGSLRIRVLWAHYLEDSPNVGLFWHLLKGILSTIPLKTNSIWE